jgi:hypothetical protein
MEKILRPKKKFRGEDSQLCDVIIVPTGEVRRGENAFHVTKQAMELFRQDKFGYMFITGGYSGFAEKKDKEGKSEAQETFEYIINSGIPEKKVLYDDQSLETLGNFTFPIVQPKRGNPKLSDFQSMMVIGQEGHMWRIKDYANVAMGDLVNKDIYFHSVPGEHNNGLMAKVYHKGFMNALKNKLGAEEAHEFLMKEHPFYSKGWYDKSSLTRKIKMAAVGVGWSLR